MKTLYLASPFFNKDQIEREERVKKKLRELNFDVWSPRENCHCEINATQNKRQKVFMDNLQAIDFCDYVFAITDSKDLGTLFECGYAYAKGKDIIYYCETFKKEFNLMLAQSAFSVITKFEILDNLEILIKNGGMKYVGNIE